MRNVQNVTGISRRSPPIWNMLCSWCSARITAPAPRKSSALKKACVMKWKIAADHAPAPSARNM